MAASQIMHTSSSPESSGDPGVAGAVAAGALPGPSDGSDEDADDAKEDGCGADDTMTDESDG